MMIVLALLMLAVAVAAVVVIAAEGGGNVTIDEFGLDMEIPVWGVFVAGAVTGLMALAAIVALNVGVRRARARRTEIKYLRQKVAHQELDDDGTAAADVVTEADDTHRRMPGRWRNRHTADTKPDTSASSEPRTHA